MAAVFALARATGPRQPPRQRPDRQRVIHHREIGNIGQANYAASKSGLFGLTKTLAKEVAFMLERSGKLTDDGLAVTVNTFTPSFIATEMVEAVPEKVIDKIKGQIPMRRLGRPEEVARVVHFLAADASS